MQKKIKARREAFAKKTARQLDKKFINNILVEKIEADLDQLQEISRILSADDRILLLFGVEDKIYVFGSAGRNLDIDIGRVVREVCERLNGRGGGSRDLGQGVCSDIKKLDATIKEMKKVLM